MDADLPSFAANTKRAPLPAPGALLFMNMNGRAQCFDLGRAIRWRLERTNAPGLIDGRYRDSRRKMC